MKELSGKLLAEGLEISIVISRFNDFLTKQLLAGALDCFVRHGGSEDKITVVWVPGANELSLATHKLLDAKTCDAVVVLGAVVQGATPHADLINGQVSRSLARTSTQFGVPVVNGVVCTNNLEQAIERCGTKAGNKGWNAVLAAIEMASLYKQI